MYSMTGFGRGEYKTEGIELSVEIKTVNNRYLDVNLKCPRIFSALEDTVRAAVKEKLTRGHADIFVGLIDKREKERDLRLDEGVAKSYVAAANKLKELFPEVGNDLSLTDILRYPDVLKSDEVATLDGELEKALVTALSSALDKLNEMRKKEGEKLGADMLSRMDAIEGLLNKVEKRAPLVVQSYKTKLESRMKTLLEGVEIDEGRILTEVAVFSDKSNIDEEITRLHSHISQFREICKETLVGRKLDFLVQEFNRETNTICSKSNDLEVTRLGLALKNEIEKIREQVQNVE